MIKQKYIKAFEKKYDLEFIEILDGEVASFEEGKFFGIDDIVFDIDHNIQKGLIMLYAQEGLNNGSMPDYKTWLADNFEE